MSGLMTGGNATFRHIYIEDVAPGAVGAAATVEVPVAVPGAKIGDWGIFGPRQALPATPAGGLVFNGARCSADNVVQLMFTNPTAASITPVATNDYDLYLLTATGQPG